QLLTHFIFPWVICRGNVENCVGKVGRTNRIRCFPDRARGAQTGFMHLMCIFSLGVGSRARQEFFSEIVSNVRRQIRTGREIARFSSPSRTTRTGASAAKGVGKNASCSPLDVEDPRSLEL